MLQTLDDDVSNRLNDSVASEREGEEDGLQHVDDNNDNGNEEEDASRQPPPLQQQNFSFVDEISGSCGDFGTLLPLLAAMARLRVIYLSPTLVLSGITHIVTGYIFDIPIPLQPMKAIASLAIAGELSRQQVTTAGIGMGICFIIFGISGNLIDLLNNWIPLSVISGVQLGVGWKLALKGVHMIQNIPSWWFTKSTVDCKVLAILCAGLCLYGLSRKRRRQHHHHQQQQQQLGGSNSDHNDEEEFRDLGHHTNTANSSLDERIHIPSSSSSSSSSSSCLQRIIDKPPVGIYLFLIGIGAAGIQLMMNSHTVTTVDDINTNDNTTHPDDGDIATTTTTTTTTEPILVNALHDTTVTDWKTGILSGTFTQLPLTTLNSCLSVCLLAHTLFPTAKVRRKVSRRRVCISIGLINTLLCPLGMMPTCHGAGGLAGQHRLGANTGISMIVLGIFKIAIGIVASQGMLLPILDAIPVSVLGVLLVLAGHELASTGVLKIAKGFSSLSSTEGNHQRAEKDIGLHNKEDEMVVCLITALVIVGTGHTHIGALSGWIACVIYGGGEFPGCDSKRNPRVSTSEESTRYSPLPNNQTVMTSPDSDD